MPFSVPIQDNRTGQLLGPDALERLSDCRVAVVGLGGVGGTAAEALVRGGIRNIVLIDFDRVDPSNINRQVLALHSTVGDLKVDVMRRRLLDIRPDADITPHAFFCTADGSEGRVAGCDFVVDAIDNVTAKIGLIRECREQNIPIICSMGTGNKLDPQRLEIADLAKTSVCPLARILRRELRKDNIRHLPVVYSREEPKRVSVSPDEEKTRRNPPGSVSFVPPAAGLLAASYVIRRLLEVPTESHS